MNYYDPLSQLTLTALPKGEPLEENLKKMKAILYDLQCRSKNG